MRRVTDTLVADLRAMQNQFGLCPDFIFYTGDSVFGNLGNGPLGAIKEQFEAAHNFLEKVRCVFSPEVPRSRLYIVPGNHDVNRLMVTPDQTQWLNTVREVEIIINMIQDGGLQWQRIIERLSDYRIFLETNVNGVSP